jgi:hypothetical protein
MNTKFLPLILLLVLLRCDTLFAQPLFAREYAAPTDLSNMATHYNTSDGGMILLSHTVGSTTFMHYNVVVKNSANGSMQWTRRFIVPNANVSNIIQLSDGTYCFAYVEVGNNNRYKVIRLDAGGNTLYSNEYLLPQNYQCMHSPDLLAKPNGGFYIASHIRQVLVTYAWGLMEIDLTGNLLWSQYYNDNVEVNIGLDLCVNGDIIVCGARGTTMSTFNNPFVTRVSSTGQFLWSKTYSFPGTNVDAYAIQELSSGNIAVVGRVANIAPAFNHAFYIQTDAAGTLVRARRYGSSQSLMQANAAVVVENDNLLVSGNGGVNGSGSFFAKIDPNCDVIYAGIFNDVYGFSLGRTTLPGYSASGMQGNSQRTFLFTTDTTMNTCLGDPYVIDTVPFQLSASPLTGAVSMTMTQAAFQPLDTFVTVHSRDLCHDSTTGIETPDRIVVVQLQPNPADDQVAIHCAERMSCIELYDAGGRLVQQTKMNTTDHLLQLSAHAPGLYFVRVQTQTGVQSLRLIIE